MTEIAELLAIRQSTVSDVARATQRCLSRDSRVPFDEVAFVLMWSNRKPCGRIAIEQMAVVAESLHRVAFQTRLRFEVALSCVGPGDEFLRVRQLQTVTVDACLHRVTSTA
jgi:hypothetical protein